MDDLKERCFLELDRLFSMFLYTLSSFKCWLSPKLRFFLLAVLIMNVFFYLSAD